MKRVICSFVCLLGLGASSCNLNFNFQQEVSSADLDYKLKYGIYGFVSPEQGHSVISVLRYFPANEFPTKSHVYKEAVVSVAHLNKGKKADLTFSVSEIGNLYSGEEVGAYHLRAQDLSIEARNEYKLSVVIEGKTYESRVIRVPSQVKELFIDQLFSRQASASVYDAGGSVDVKEWYLRIRFKDLPDVEYYRLMVHEIREEFYGIPYQPQEERQHSLVSSFQDEVYVDARGENLEWIKRDLRIGAYDEADEVLDFEAIAVTVISADKMYYRYHVVRDSEALWDPDPVFGEPVVLPENMVYEDLTGIFGAFRILHKRFEKGDIKVLGSI